MENNSNSCLAYSLREVTQGFAGPVVDPVT